MVERYPNGLLEVNWVAFVEAVGGDTPAEEVAQSTAISRCAEGCALEVEALRWPQSGSVNQRRTKRPAPTTRHSVRVSPGAMETNFCGELVAPARWTPWLEISR